MNMYEGIMQGLEEAVAYSQGKISARTATISITPLPEYDAHEIKSIRKAMGMTQTLFAGFMGVSPKTVEAWESGRNTPNGPAKRILSMLQKDPTLPQRMQIIEE